jgi:DHA1 family tetracycline resistance protein-like MFS transporter
VRDRSQGADRVIGAAGRLGYDGCLPEERSVSARLSAWLARWSPVLPLLAAEGVIALGFGAILPILSIFYTQHGVSLEELGIVVAAWPAARLVGEPLFGRLADRVSRKWMMVVALVVSAFAVALPVAVEGTAAFIVLRLIAGLGASAYDPAARGYLMDANPPERQGELFGLYSAAQMGGFMVGPAVGGLAAAATGNPAVVFWVFGLAYLVSAVVVAVRVADLSREEAKALALRYATPATETGEADGDEAEATAVASPQPATQPDDEPHPAGLLNRLLLVALVLNVGAYLAGGAYEVIWAVYMTSLGAGVALIGMSFFTFSLPVMLLSPFVGRYVDRRGGYLAMVVGGAGVGICGLLYPLVPSPWWMIWLGIVEGIAAALGSPSLYMLVSRAAPANRSSTAQGLFGAAGTTGTITASVVTGFLAAIDLRLPYIAMGAATLVLLALGVAVGGRVLYEALQPHPAHPAVLAEAEA